MSNKRRLLMIFFGFTLLVAGWQLTALMNEYSFNTILPIEKVEIEGEFNHISHDVFSRQVTAVIDGGYFSLNLEVMKTALMNLPWVDDVSIRRQWPSSLHIKVTEKRAVAYWNNNALISDRGDVFKPEDISGQLLLPKLNGPEGLHNKMWIFLTTINQEFSAMGFEVVDLSLDERRAWSLHFVSENVTEKIQVKLGRDYADNRLVRFVRVFSNRDKFNLENIAVIDFRYPNGFAMKIKNNNITANRRMSVSEA